MVSRELYLTLSRCHAVLMRSRNNPELVEKIENWLDENLENIEEERQEPEHISSILERCVSELQSTIKGKTDEVVVSLQKHIVVLYPSEIQRLLSSDTDLYIKAIRRGKNEKRIRTNEYRTSRYIEK